MYFSIMNLKHLVHILLIPLLLISWHVYASTHAQPSTDCDHSSKVVAHHSQQHGHNSDNANHHGSPIDDKTTTDNTCHCQSGNVVNAVHQCQNHGGCQSPSQCQQLSGHVVIVSLKCAMIMAHLNFTPPFPHENTTGLALSPELRPPRV